MPAEDGQEHLWILVHYLQLQGLEYLGQRALDRLLDLLTRRIGQDNLDTDFLPWAEHEVGTVTRLAPKEGCRQRVRNLGGYQNAGLGDFDRTGACCLSARTDRFVQ